MTYTATNLKDDTINYGGDEVAEIGESLEQFLIWVNMALVNRHEDICALFNKWNSDIVTVVSKGYEADVPTDWDNLSEMILYTDAARHSEYDSWEYQFGVHIFEREQAAGTIYYRRYRLQPNTYTAMADDLLECANPRTRKIIMEEVIAMYLSSQNDLESNNAEQAALGKANRNG